MRGDVEVQMTASLVLVGNYSGVRQVIQAVHHVAGGGCLSGLR